MLVCCDSDCTVGGAFCFVYIRTCVWEYCVLRSFSIRRCMFRFLCLLEVGLKLDGERGSSEMFTTRPLYLLQMYLISCELYICMYVCTSINGYAAFCLIMYCVYCMYCMYCMYCVYFMYCVYCVYNLMPLCENFPVILQNVGIFLLFYKIPM